MKCEERKKKQLMDELAKSQKQNELLMAALKTSSVELVDTISDNVTDRVASEKARKIMGDISELFLRCRGDNSVYHELAQLLSAYSGFPSVTIELCDRSVENVMFIGWAGFPEGAVEPAQASVSETFSGEVARTGQPILSTEECNHQNHSSPVWKKIESKTLLSIPMKAGKRVVGVLTLGHPDEREIASKQIDALQAVADYVGQQVERKQAAEALRESEANYGHLADSIGDVFYAMDENLTYTYWNRASEKLTGVLAEDAIGRSLYELFPKVKGTKADELYISVLETRRPASVIDVYRLGNRDHFFEINAYPFKGGLSVFVRDITKQKKAEEALHQRTHDLEKRVKELKCLYQVGSLLSTPNISLGDLIQKTAVLLPAGWQYPSITCARIVLEGIECKTENFEKANWRQSSDIKVAGQNHGSVEVGYLEERSELDEGPFLKEERNLIDAIAEELGRFLERARTEKEKEKIEAQLRQAQKMEAIGRLAGGMAHDFNNVLTAIRGYSDLALMKLPGKGPPRKDIENVREASIRAAKLTEQLLLLSRPQPVTFKSLNLNKVISDLLKMFERVIGENFPIVTDLDPVLRSVYADVGHMEQTIMNMVVNAKDAMPEGGEITIRTENADIGRDYCVTHSYARPGQFVCLSIEDTGVGMDNWTMTHIFEPFFTTKDQKKGTGLGLSIVYGIVRQHKGWMDVESTLGEGSTFKIYLPSRLQIVKEENKETSSNQTARGEVQEERKQALGDRQ